MFNIKKQIRALYTVSALGSFRIAGASWVALLAARGFSLAEIGIAEGVFHGASLLFEIPSGVISDVFGRKTSMLLSQCMFLLSALLMAFSEGLTGVCVSLTACAFGYNFASGTREALAYDSLKAAGQEEGYLAYSSREYSIYRIGSACGTLCAGLALLLGNRRAALLCTLGIAGGLALSLHTAPLVMILGGFLGNLFDDLLQVRTDALLNERFPSAQRATLVSVSSLTFSLTMILISPLMGWLLSI